MHNFIEDMANLMKAYGDSTRLKIVKILALNQDNKIYVGDLSQKLGVTSGAVSQHLRILKSIDVVESIREGNKIQYKLNLKTFKQHKSNFDMLFELAFKNCGN